MTTKAPSVQRSTFTIQALPGCVPQFDQDSQWTASRNFFYTAARLAARQARQGQRTLC